MWDLETIKYMNSPERLEETKLASKFERERRLVMTREYAMRSPSVHNLTKDILKLSEDKDIVGRYYDVMLAAKILKTEMEDRW